MNDSLRRPMRLAAIRGASRRLLELADRVRSRRREEQRRWALNIALLFIALAHRTDGDLSLNELDVIFGKLRGHLPGADDATLMYLMQEALRAYDEGRMLDAVEAADLAFTMKQDPASRVPPGMELLEGPVLAVVPHLFGTTVFREASLPLFPAMKDEDVGFVAAALKDVLGL